MGIAWRLKKRNFCNQLLDLLHKRNHYDKITYSYALKHDFKERATEYLKFSSYSDQCGMYLNSSLLTIDPITRFQYQHREYGPLVNARPCQLGNKCKILNQEFRIQYNKFMKYLRYKNILNAEDRLICVYYLLLQDRIDEALTFFHEIKRRDIIEKIQYDYLNAYIHFYMEQPRTAANIANNYTSYPIIKWREKFLNILKQVNETFDEANVEIDAHIGNMVNDDLASKEASIDFSIDNEQVIAHIRNIKKVKTSYYKMDIELLFSRKPFIYELSSDFSIIQPNMVEYHTVSNNKLIFKIPKTIKRLQCYG